MSGRAPSGLRFSVLAIVAVILFSASVILSVAVFVYQKSLVGQVNKINAELITMKSSFEESLIDELIRLDKRIEAAKLLLSKHRVTVPFFDLLEKSTLQGVRFSNLEISADAKGVLTVEMDGQAISFNSIALQSDVFGAEPKMRVPSFSGVNVDEKGNAKFSFKASLDEKSFLYRSLIKPKTEPVKTNTDEMELDLKDVNSSLENMVPVDF